ncbi:MAG TPA: hypothetical protein VKU85_07850 [bacterium]|nr:hypothetical protein [bacterium]
MTAAPPNGEPRPGAALRTATAFAPVLLAYLLLVRHFDFLCDDAYITFRYARNLAEGASLRFNPGAPAVEGYSNFLWVIWNALIVKLGANPEAGARLTSAALGVHLLWSVFRRAERFGAAAAVAAGAFLALLAPFSAWTTGGLATVPFAWTLWMSWMRFAGEERARPVAAGLFALAACLLRNDGPVFLAIVYGAALVAADPERRTGLLRAAAVAAGVTVAGLIPYHAWRLWHFGDWVPQSARVKVTFSALAAEQGAKYLATLMLAFPGIALAPFVPWPRLDGTRRRLAVAGAVIALGGWAYIVFVGGDWMALGRFVVPMLPFVALSLGARCTNPRAIAAAAAVIVVSLPGAADRSPVPRAWQEALHFRWNSDDIYSEVGFWRKMNEDTAQQVLLGRALKEHTSAGDSIALGAVGAAPYFADLFVYDRNGLVTREVTESGEPLAHRSPGHLRNVSPLFFLPQRPTILRAVVAPDSLGVRAIRMPLPTAAEDDYERVAIPLDPARGFPEGHSLVMIRRRS